MKKSEKLLQHTINNSFLKIIEKGGHGEISLIHTERYIELLQHFFANTAD